MRTNKIHYKVAIAILAVFLLLTKVTASETDEEKKQRLREAKIRKSTTESFVVVHYHFKKSERPKPPDDDYDFDESDTLEKILAKKTVDVVGVIISGDGRILTAENYLPPEVIEKITVTGCDGKTLGAYQEMILTKAPGEVIRATEPLPERWKPLNFVTAPDVLDIKSKLYGISLLLGSGAMPSMWMGAGPTYYSEDEEDQCFFVMRAEPVRQRDNQSEVPDYFNLGGKQTIVICDANGLVLGATNSGRIELGKKAPAWQGSDILADPGIKRKAGEEKIKELFSKYLYQIKITFRPPPKEEDDYDMGMYASFWGRWYEDSEEGKEMFVYGLAIAQDKLLLPLAMARELVAGIDTITVQVDDEYFGASFAGVLKEFEGTVIQLEETKLTNVISIDQQVSLARVEPFWTVFARELAGKDLVVNYNRWIHKKRGYKNKLYQNVENNLRSGSWLLDRHGRFTGLYTGARREYQRLLPYLMGDGYESFGPGMMSFGRITHRFSRGWYSSSDLGDRQIFDTAMLNSVLKDLTARYDCRIKHLTKDEQKRRVWLGIEFTGVSKEMAKQLNLRRHTQDGRIGLMINRLYPNSPASRIGLAEGDVLLKLEVPEAPWPIELKIDSDRDFGGPDWDDFDVPDEFEAMGYRMPRKRPWPSRDNFFTRMLNVIGEGVPVQLTYVHESNELQKEFVIEQSPPDTLSAKKYKDKKLGITVKNLTYEIRTALKLSEDDKAIVVSKVEQGTPTALARINMFELIRAVDGQEISSVDEFESVIEKAKEEAKESVRVTVEWMGKTRLADLKFEAKGETLKNMMQLIPGLPSSDDEDQID